MIWISAGLYFLGIAIAFVGVPLMLARWFAMNSEFDRDKIAAHADSFRVSAHEQKHGSAK